MMKKRQRK